MYFIKALTVPNEGPAFAYAINSTGTIVGYADEWAPGEKAAGDPPLHLAGVAWASNGVFLSSLDPESQSILYAISDSGVAVGTRDPDFNVYDELPFYVHAGGIIDLTVVGAGAMALISSDYAGGAIGGWRAGGADGPGGDPSFVPAYIYRTIDRKGQPEDGSVTWFVSPDGSGASLLALNNSGETLMEVTGLNGDPAVHQVYYNYASDTSGAGTITVGSPTSPVTDLGTGVVANALNNVGVMCGETVSGDNYLPMYGSVRVASPVFTPIPLLPGASSGNAYAINDNGTVVGACLVNGSYIAYVSYDGLTLDLNTQISTPGWSLERALGIDNAGRIIGAGTFNGQAMSFLLTPQALPKGPIVPHLHDITIPQLVATLLGGVTADGGGWRLIGGHWSPVDPWEAWMKLPSAKRDALLALALDEAAVFLSDTTLRQQVREALLNGARSSLDELLASASQRRMHSGSSLPAARPGPHLKGRLAEMKKVFEERRRRRLQR
jgi:hypothetical protein